MPEWYAGNIYDLERAVPRMVDLPVPPDPMSTSKYDIFISADYEVNSRLAMLQTYPVVATDQTLWRSPYQQHRSTYSSDYPICRAGTFPRIDTA